MPYTCELVETLTAIGLDAWNQVCPESTDPFMDARFARAVESSMSGDARFWTAIVRDDRGCPAAAACVSLFPVDGALLANPRAQRSVARVRRVLPRFLTFRVLFVGLPVSASQSHLRMRESADPGEVVRSLDAALGELARRHGAKWVVWKEFDREEATRLDGLRKAGYLRADSLPSHYLATNFPSLDHFCAALRSRYRKNILASRRKFHDAGLAVEHVQGPQGADRRLSDELHRLYLNVLAHSSDVLERLPAGFFREFFRQWGEQSLLSIVHDQGRPIAWGCSLLRPPEGHLLFLGLDYERKAQGDVYFNLVYECLDEAMRQGITGVWLGANSESFKLRLGCSQHPRYFFIKGRGLLGRLLPLGQRALFPTAPLRRRHNTVRFPVPETAASAAEEARS